MAVGSYDANGIWQYGESDNISPFATTLNKLASSASSAITADRARLATLEAGSLSGLVPIKPGTITAAGGTASMNTLGVITFSGCTSIQLDTLFTSAYKNYFYIFNAGTTSANATVLTRLRSAGVVRTTGYYSGWTRVNEVGATSTGNLSGSSYFFTTDVHISVPISNATATIFEPRSTTKQCCFKNDFVGFVPGGTYAGYSGGTVGGISDVFDGLQLDTSSGTFGGTLQIFGFND